MSVKKILYRFILLVILVFCSQISIFAVDQPIKVGFTYGDGFHTMEVNGGYSGYNYDYLMKIAQYTGWEYEFIVIHDSDSLSAQEIAERMLQQGSLDLLGSMYLTEESVENFEFGEKNYGIARHVLCALGNNNQITPNTYFLQENLTVALVQDNEEAEKAFHLIMDGQGQNFQIIYVNTQQEALNLLLNETVDCIMSTDVSSDSNILNALATSSPSPFYFASTKGNVSLLKEMDMAISYIEKAEYTIQNQLVDEYFGLLHTGNIILSNEEVTALADYPYLTVGLLKGREPYQFYDENEERPHGISVDIIEEISEIIGVEFRYLWLDSRQEMKEKIASQEIDLCSTVPFDSHYELTYFFDVVLTQPYLTNAVAWIHHNEESDDTKPLYYYLADNIPFFPDEELTEVIDFGTALFDLSQKNDTSIFTDPLMAQYQIQKLGITNAEIQNVSSMNSKICFGVGKHLDPIVVGLLNHAILHLDPFIVDNIIYQNVTVQNSITFTMFMREHSLEILCFITFCFVAIVFMLVYHSKKLRQLSQEDSLTKLYNAGHFHSYATEKTKKIQQGCLILIDIDYFKQVNDTYGHQMGDTIIILVSKTIQSLCVQQGKVARLGGDEFVILIENPVDQAELEEKSRELLNFLVQNHTNVPVTLSIGGYIFKKQIPYESLYRMTDEVLYKVKENGRNGYLFTQNE